MKKAFLVCIAVLISILSFGQAPIGGDSLTQQIKGVVKIQTGLAMPIISPGVPYKQFWKQDTVALLYVDSTTGNLCFMKNGVVDTVIGNGGVTIGAKVGGGASGAILYVDGSGNLGQDGSFGYSNITQQMSISGASFGNTGENTIGIADREGGLVINYALDSKIVTYFATTDMRGFGIANLASPSDAGDAVNKAYVDGLATGLSWKSLVRLATIATLNPASTYNNGTAGVGATLTGNSVGILTIDGRNVVLNDRILVQNESDPTHNGIYLCTTAGTGGVAYILTRTTDANTGSLLLRATLAVSAGATDSNKAFTQVTPATITIGTSNIIFTQFLNTVYTAGTGLNLTTNVFKIADAGVAGIYGNSTQVPVFTTNGQGQVISVTNTDISGTPPGGSAGGDLTGVYPNPTLVATAVDAASYGSATQVGTFTVDAKGRLTAASNTTISGVAPGGAAGGDLAGTYPNPTIKTNVALAGSPTTTTQAQTDSSDRVSTTAFVKAKIQTITTTNFTTSYTINSTDTRNYQLSITAQAGSLLFNNPTGTIVDNQLFFIKIKSTSAQVLTWGSQFAISSDGPALPATTNAGKWMYLLFVENATSNKLYLISFANNF